MNVDRLEQQLVLHEGLRLQPYPDTDDPPNWTLGVGYNVTARGLEQFDHVIGRTIAWELGQPVHGPVITAAEATTMLRADIARLEPVIRARFPEYNQLSDVRQRVCFDMAFNMGLHALGFVKTIAAVKRGDWSTAAKELYHSKWVNEVGRGRVDRLANMLLTNVDYSS